MKILFIGAVKFSESILSELIRLNSNVVGVCTVSESIANFDHCSLSIIAADAGIPICLTPNINCIEAVAWIKDRNPDIIFCFGWSQLIKKPLLDLAPLGVVGYHPSALPENRGRHPLI